MGRIGVLLLLTLLTVAAPSAYGLSADQLRGDQTWLVNHVTFTGNSAVSDTELRNAIRIKERPIYMPWRPRPKFDPDAFSGDIARLKRLYESRGYYHTRIAYDLETAGNLVGAAIAINEGPQVKVTSVRVDAPEDGAGLAHVISLQPGSGFTEAAYQQGEADLREYFLTRGYGRASVKRSAELNPATNQVSVKYAVTRGPATVFGSTRVEGLHSVTPNVVLRELTYKAGEVFSPKKIEDSRKVIVALKLFSVVEFQPDLKAGEPGVLPMVVKVVEQPPHEVKLGGGYGTQDQFFAQASWADHNWLGDARDLSFLAQYSTIENAAEARFLQRHFPTNAQDVVIDAKVLYETEQEFDLFGAQLLPLLQTRLSPELTLSGGFRSEFFKLSGMDAPAVQDIGGVTTRGFLFGPTLHLIWNTTEDPFNPRQGQIVTFNADQAGKIWGGKANYYKLTAEVRKYTYIGEGFILANRLEVGVEESLGHTKTETTTNCLAPGIPPGCTTTTTLVSDGVPIFERFYSGGPGSVRGYGRWDIGPRSVDNVPLGGLSLLEGSVELRHSIYKGLSGAGFVDFGDVSLSSYHPPIGSLKFGAGPALMYDTPVGPLRFDLGFPFQKPPGDQAWQIYFSIGQYF